MANHSTTALGYRINYREGTISVSDRLINEANRAGVNSSAYNTLKALREMGMPIVKFRENTTARKGLTYMKEFNNIRLLSKGQPSPYKYVRMWFKAKFPLFGSISMQFDADNFIVERITVQETVKVEKNAPAIPALDVYEGLLKGA